MAENHGFLYMPDGSFQRANYMGPGTDVMGRLERGDRGKTFMDEVSQLHDIEYMLAKGRSSSDKEAARYAREADLRMVEHGKTAWRHNKDHWFNVSQGGGLITAKMFLEDWGIIHPNKFVGKHSARYLKGAEERGVTEGEFLHRKRAEILRNGPLQDLQKYQSEYGSQWAHVERAASREVSVGLQKTSNSFALNDSL